MPKCSRCIVFSVVLISGLILSTGLTGCFSKSSDSVARPTDDQIQPVALSTAQDKNQNEKNISKALFSKTLRESIFFAASLEREALRLMSQNKSFEKPTLFSVLSYAIEVNSGTKKNPPSSLDCSRWRFEKNNKKIYLYKSCQKPEALMAVLTERSIDSDLQVEFKSKEWSTVLGLAVSITNPEVVCQIKIKETGRLKSFSCQHWSFLLQQNQTSSTEVRLSRMDFERDRLEQFILQGGFFKDLIEYKKIEIKVPLTGQIKLIEKELEVKDDFAAEKIKYDQQSQNQQVQGETHGDQKAQEKSFEKKQQEESYQKWIKEGEKKESQSENKKSSVATPSTQIQPESQPSQQEDLSTGYEEEVSVPAEVPAVETTPVVPDDRHSGGVPALPGRGR